MLRFKHLRLDQGKIERVKEILKARTETEALDKALDKVIAEDRERLRKKEIVKRIIRLRSQLGEMKEDSAEWVRRARRERGQTWT